MKVTLDKNQRLYFTSDTHYSHSNICRGVSNWTDDNMTRDFESLDQMNDAIVNSINAKVGENDILVHLGDWSFGGFDKIEEFRNRIICKNIILFLGNHDHHIERNKENIRSLFMHVTTYELLEISRPNGKEVDKYKFICMHYPIASWDQMGIGVPHLHGHIHLPPELKIHDGKSMDVGTDGNNLEPYSLDEILEIMDSRPIKPLSLPRDHH